MNKKQMKEKIINDCQLYKNGLCISPLGDEIKCDSIPTDKCYFKQKVLAEQERDYYRNALEGIKEMTSNPMCKRQDILGIINKAKGERDE